jgi:hypothetical protein
MTTSREITNNAVGFKHLGPGAMTGVFNQQPARVTATKQTGIGKCGAGVTLEAHTTASAVVMSVGECGLSGVVCNDCATLIELISEPTDEPGLHMRG